MRNLASLDCDTFRASNSLNAAANSFWAASNSTFKSGCESTLISPSNLSILSIRFLTNSEVLWSFSDCDTFRVSNPLNAAANSFWAASNSVVNLLIWVSFSASRIFIFSISPFNSSLADKSSIIIWFVSIIGISLSIIKVKITGSFCNSVSRVFIKSS